MREKKGMCANLSGLKTWCVDSHLGKYLTKMRVARGSASPGEILKNRMKTWFSVDEMQHFDFWGA